MREQFSSKPEFFFNTNADLKVVKKYHDKYNEIDNILEKNPKILMAVHDDLYNKMGSLKGRNADYSTEMLFRMLLIKCIEQLSFRDLDIQVNDSAFLRNFARIGWGKVMSFTILDAAWKCIDDQNKKITGTDLRIDSSIVAI